MRNYLIAKFFLLSFLVLWNCVPAGAVENCPGVTIVPLGGGSATKLWDLSGQLGYELPGGITTQVNDTAPVLKFSDASELVKLVVDLGGDALVFTSRSRGYSVYRLHANAGQTDWRIGSYLDTSRPTETKARSRRPIRNCDR